MIRSHPVRRVVATNTISQLVGKVATASITFILSILIARRYGTEGYGDFVKITTFVAFFYLLADFGINAVYLQQHKKLTTSADDGWSVLLGLRTAISLFLFVLVIVLLSWLPQGIHQGYTSLVRLGIILYCPTILFQALLTTANAQFQKHLRYELSTIAVLVGSVVTLVLLWFGTQMFASVDTGMLAVVGSLVIGSLVTAAAALVFVRPLVGVLRVTFAPRQLLALLVASIPLGITLVFNLVYFRVDSFILALTRSTAEVGIYGLAYKVFEVPLVLPTFFMNAVYPLMVSQTGGKAFLVIIKKSFVTLLLGSCLLSLALWYAAPLLSLVRADFAGSIAPLRVLALGLPLFFVSSLSMWALIALGKQRALAAIYGLSMVVTVGATAWFVPRVGYMAAAWITVISEAMVLLVSSFVLAKRLGKV